MWIMSCLTAHCTKTLQPAAEARRDLSPMTSNAQSCDSRACEPAVEQRTQLLAQRGDLQTVGVRWVLASRRGLVVRYNEGSQEPSVLKARCSEIYAAIWFGACAVTGRFALRADDGDVTQ